MPKRDLLKEVLNIFGASDCCHELLSMPDIRMIAVRSKTLAKLGQDWQETMKRTLQSEDY